MTAWRYALGVICLLVVCGSLAASALTLRGRFFPEATGALARLIEWLLALALLIAVSEVLGTVGAFRLVAIVVVCALVALGVVRAVGGNGLAEARAARLRESVPLSRSTAHVVALLAIGAVVAEWAAPTVQSYKVGILSFDSLWYHLPWAASFAQTGHITPLRFTDVEYLTAFYPATAEALHGLGIVLLGRDTLSPAINLLWLTLALLAGYCVGRPRGAGTLTATGTAVAMAVPMFSSSQGGTAANDVLGVFFLLGAAALLMAADGRTPMIILSATSAGLAVGVKLSVAAPVAALTVGVIAFAPAGHPGDRLRLAGRWLVPVVLAGGFWYVRNLIAVGNPLPWFGFGGLLATPDPALQQHTAFAVAHYLFSGRTWAHVFEPALHAGLGPWWPAIIGAALLGPLLCLLPGAGRMVRLLGLVALASWVAYVLTPESAAGPRGQPLGFAFNLRYAAPALALGLTVLPLAPVLGGERRRLFPLGALALLLVATLSPARLWPTRDLAWALAIAAVAMLLLFWRRPRTQVLAALLAAVAVGGWWVQRHYLAGRYRFHPHVSYLASTWALFRQVHDARVGVVGTFGGFFSYPLYGLDDSNRVQYVGLRGARGSFKPIRTCAAWRAAVDSGHYRYLVTTPARDPWNPSRLGPSPEGRWTRSSHRAQLIYSRLAAGTQISVFRLSGPVGLAGCG